MSRTRHLQPARFSAVCLLRSASTQQKAGPSQPPGSIPAVWSSTIAGGRSDERDSQCPASCGADRNVLLRGGARFAMSCFMARARFAMSCFVARARFAMSCFVARVEPMSCSSASITALAFGAGTSMLSSASYNVNSKPMPPPPRMAECRAARHAATDNSVALANIRTAFWPSFDYQTAPHNSAETPRFSNTDRSWSVHCSSRPQCRKCPFHDNCSIIAARSCEASFAPGGRRSDWQRITKPYVNSVTIPDTGKTHSPS